MERTISLDERIRRAEEIYNRRKSQNGVRVSTSRVNTTKNRFKLYKKLILQIVTCFTIYLVFYLVKNSNYIFSENFITKTKEFLSYDINFVNIYNSATDYYNKNIKSFFMTKENDKEKEEKEQTNTEIENTNSVESVGGIGGGEETTHDLLVEVKQVSAQATVQLSQMEIDANEIKKKVSLTLPLKGTISSRYGPRQGSKIVSSNHLGIDIAANEGTVFVSAMSGIVTVASSEGSYGKHIYIQNGDIITVYAHCSKLYVKEGDKISQGQKIGEVGQTGNATGPHLHFEIRRGNRTINPELVLKFG